MRALTLVASLTFAAATVACIGSGDANLLENASFEDGGDPWFSLDSETWGEPFTVSDQQAKHGDSSALLELRSATEPGPERIYGAVQDVTTETFPDVLSGSYYVERWQRGTELQYLQAVVIVEGAANAPAGIDASNHQVRYVLTGAGDPPLELGNARYVIAGERDPEVGMWVDFEFAVSEDFQRLWGVVPEGFESLRVLFEVRWDGRVEAELPARADVYYDDLYLGSR